MHSFHFFFDASSETVWVHVKRCGGEDSETAEHTPQVSEASGHHSLRFTTATFLSSSPHRYTCTFGMKWCGEDAQHSFHYLYLRIMKCSRVK